MRNERQGEGTQLGAQLWENKVSQHLLLLCMKKRGMCMMWGKGEGTEGMGQATAPSGGGHISPILSPLSNYRMAEAGRDQ